MPAAPDSTDWPTRLNEALMRSVEHAEEVMTRHPEVQAWLRRASLEAAMEAGPGGGAEAVSAAYGFLLDDLRRRFPTLVRAVAEITGGCARLDVQWRPLSPSYSRLRLDFGTDFRVHAFRHLDAPEEAAARSALDAIARHLPRGLPFKGHPNEANGVVAFDGECVGVRIRETQSDGARHRTIAFRAKGQAPVDALADEEAAPALVQLLTRDTGSASWIDSHR